MIEIRSPACFLRTCHTGIFPSVQALLLSIMFNSSVTKSFASERGRNWKELDAFNDFHPGCQGFKVISVVSQFRIYPIS